MNAIRQWVSVNLVLGSLVVLAWVNWPMILGGLLLSPVVFFTHRTWISRIRPLHRAVRAQRQEIDSYATEAFGGMRVVRAFGRERSEALRFVRGNNLLVRQQLFAWWWARGIELTKREQRRRLLRLLLKGAIAHGYATELWTTARLAEVIEAEFRVKYHPDHVGRLMHSLG